MGERVSADLPLTGLRVLDSVEERGELCGRLLADLGAEVVRIEPPGGGRTRSWEPAIDGVGLAFAVRNTNKRGLTLDLDGSGPTAADDRERFLELLEGADVWIDDAAPGQRAAIGLDPAEVSRRFPSLTVTSITDFGHTGPYRDFEATNDVMVGLAWMLFKAGNLDWPPVLPPGSLAYDIAGITAAFATLTAHLRSLQTGKGDWLDVSVMEAVAQTTDWGLSNVPIDAEPGDPGPAEIRSGAGPIYPIIRCLDGWVRPSVVTLAEWHKMRDWLGDPEVLRNERYDTTPGRVEDYETVIRPLYEAHFAGRRMIEAAEEGQDRRIPITPLLRPDNIATAPQYVALGSFTEATLVDGVRGPVASGFYTFDGDRIGVRSPAPSVGAADAPAWEPRQPDAHSPVSATGERRGGSGGPFEGVRVLDFGVAGAAPEVARLLGEYGAEVIRVETPKRPDLFRQLGGPGLMSAVYASSNRSKDSFGVDLDDAEGRQLVLDLVEQSDVVVENLPAGTMERWGLGPDELRSANPNVFAISSQTMGRRGPWSHWRGYGANTQPVGGLTYLWSHPDAAEPTAANVAFPDHVVGRLGAVAAAAHLVARHHREVAGVHVEIVQAEVCLNVLADLFFAGAVGDEEVGPPGNRSERGAPWGVYPTAGNERWCVICCRGDDEWRRLVDAMGSPGWAGDERFATASSRRAAHDDLDEALAKWTTSLTDVEVMERLQTHGVAAGRMMYLSDQPHDPHLQDRGYLRRIDQPGLGEMYLDGPSFRGGGLPDARTEPAPRLGEHTRQLAERVLGLDEARIEKLITAGTLYQTDTKD